MAGYSKRPLVEKLGVKPGMRVLLLRMPDSILKEISPLPEGVKILSRQQAEIDYIHFFAEDEADLIKALPGLKKSLAKNGLLWISWRKGRVDTDLTDNVVRDAGLKIGLVDVKVCAVDEKWSGLKLVYRLKDR